MNHNSKFIKVQFSEEKFRNDLRGSDSEISSVDSTDETETEFSLIQKHLSKTNWILEGDRDTLEKELRVALNGDLWTEDWMERGPHGEGWYQDNWIIRHINAGYGKYIDTKAQQFH